MHHIKADYKSQDLLSIVLYSFMDFFFLIYLPRYYEWMAVCILEDEQFVWDVLCVKVNKGNKNQTNYSSDKRETHKTDELNKLLVTSRRILCKLLAIKWRQNERNIVFNCTATLFACFLNKRYCFVFSRRSLRFRSFDQEKHLNVSFRAASMF